MAGEAYDRFMGRYSRLLAADLADWLEVAAGQRAVDVGCGPGALTGVLVERLGADHVAAVDPSSSFVEACRSRFPGVDVRLAAAESLPFDGAGFDVAAACLVVHFMTNPVGGLTEMARVTRPGGRVGATVWDLAGGREPMAPLWQVMRELDPPHPGERGLQGGAAGQLEEIFDRAGLEDVKGVELAVTVTHPTFEEWWEPYTLGVGPAGDHVAGLDPARREALREECRSAFPTHGPFDVTATAWAVRAHA